MSLSIYPSSLTSAGPFKFGRGVHELNKKLNDIFLVWEAAAIDEAKTRAQAAGDERQRLADIQKRREEIRKHSQADWLTDWLLGTLLFFFLVKRGRLGRGAFNDIYFLLFSAVIISPAWYDSRYIWYVCRSSSLYVNNLARSQARYMIFVSILCRDIILLLKNAKKKTPASISFILHYYYGRLICQGETVKLQWDDDEL